MVLMKKIRRTHNGAKKTMFSTDKVVNFYYSKALTKSNPSFLTIELVDGVNQKIRLTGRQINSLRRVLSFR